MKKRHVISSAKIIQLTDFTNFVTFFFCNLNTRIICCFMIIKVGGNWTHNIEITKYVLPNFIDLNWKNWSLGQNCGS